MITRIESKNNQTLRHLMRLGREKKYRKQTGEMLCEGKKMLEEALVSGVLIQQVIIRESFADDMICHRLLQQSISVFAAPDYLFDVASDVNAPQNIIFSCKQPVWTAEDLDGKTSVLLLDGLQDPGNLGTILRTADAFAIGGVVLCEGCTDPFAPKVVRATMGAIFRLPCVEQTLEMAIRRMREKGVPVYAAALTEDSVPIGELCLTKAALIIGNEGSGVSKLALEQSDKRIVISMKGRAESLNAGVAAAILLYEMSK